MYCNRIDAVRLEARHGGMCMGESAVTFILDTRNKSLGPV